MVQVVVTNVYFAANITFELVAIELTQVSWPQRLVRWISNGAKDVHEG